MIFLRQLAYVARCCGESVSLISAVITPGTLRLVGAILFCATAFCSSPSLASVAPPRYRLINLGALGNDNTYTYGINIHGQVVGYSWASGGRHAFLYDGKIHDLGTLGGERSFASDVNNRGQVTGEANLASGAHAFIYDGVMHDLGAIAFSSSGQAINEHGHVTGFTNDGVYLHAMFYDGVMHDIGTLGGAASVGHDINDHDVIVGDSSGLNFRAHAFLYDGTMHDLGTLGGDVSAAYGINNAGHIVGYARTADGSERAFIYDRAMRPLDASFGSSSVAYDINSSDSVVGTFKAAKEFHAFVYAPGFGMVDLNSRKVGSASVELIEANAINDAGQIAAWGRFNNRYHSYLLTPIPEPRTSRLLTVFFGAALFAIRASFLRPYCRSRPPRHKVIDHDQSGSMEE